MLRKYGLPVFLLENGFDRKIKRAMAHKFTVFFYSDGLVCTPVQMGV